jgi:hypothetical protein
MVHRSMKRTFLIQWRAKSSARMLKMIGISRKRNRSRSDIVHCIYL